MNKDDSISENKDADNTNEVKPLIDFPERFPIKIFGLDNIEFEKVVESIINTHVDKIDLLNWHTNESSKGKYLAITVTILARSQAQLDTIYYALTASELVKMAL